jgi:hypothetical protein
MAGTPAASAGLAPVLVSQGEVAALVFHYLRSNGFTKVRHPQQRACSEVAKLAISNHLGEWCKCARGGGG